MLLMSNAFSGGVGAPQESLEYIEYRRAYSAYITDYYTRYLPELDAYNRSLQANIRTIRRRRIFGATVAAVSLVGVVGRNSGNTEESGSARTSVVTPALIAKSNAELSSLNFYWDEQTQRLFGQTMPDPVLTESISRNCRGEAYGAAYCPSDSTIYINLGEIASLGEAMRDVAPDYALALTDESVVSVVLAHEYGHHVQEIYGISPTGSDNAERISDCLAGAAIQNDGSVSRETLAVISYLVGDDVASSPHQTPDVRLADSLVGYDYGIDACYGL